jgi:glucose-6-phosphate dehydrogenase assembly protein OpcA
VSLESYAIPGADRNISSEVIELRLLGRRAKAPASVAEPLFISDLPVFLRWRGECPFGSPELEDLVDVADRLIVDSAEWPEHESGYERLAELFDRVTVSDIAWARTEPWRTAVAALWPDIADASRVRIAGPQADALLVVRWLSSRLDRGVELEWEPAGEIELVEVDGRQAAPQRFERRSPSDLLSEQLEIFNRDRVYEETLRSFSPVPT